METTLGVLGFLFTPGEQLVTCVYKKNYTYGKNIWAEGRGQTLFSKLSGIIVENIFFSLILKKFVKTPLSSALLPKTANSWMVQDLAETLNLVWADLLCPSALNCNFFKKVLDKYRE